MIKHFTLKSLFILATFTVLATKASGQSGDPLTLLKEVQSKTLAYDDQFIQFSMVIEATRQDGRKQQRRTSGQVQVVGKTALLTLQGQKIFFEETRLVTVSDDDEEIVVRKLDGDETQYTPASILKQYESGSNFQWAGEETLEDGVKIKYIRMKPKNSSEVRDIVLGIHMGTKRVYSYQEYGTNDITTLLKIIQYDVNQGTPASKVTFNRSNYPGYEYIAPSGM